MKFYFILAILMVFLSCKKPAKETLVGQMEIYDTIKPLSYYPVFPGSYWTYLVRHKDPSEGVHKFSVSQEYTLYDHTTGKIYVPLYEGAPVMGYDRVSISKDYFIRPTFNTFLSEKVGDVFIEHFPRESHYFQNSQSERLVIEKQYINSENRNVLVVKGNFLWALKPKMFDSARVSIREYTKSIGLTFHAIVDTNSHDTIYRAKLAEYRIGK